METQYRKISRTHRDSFARKRKRKRAILRACVKASSKSTKDFYKIENNLAFKQFVIRQPSISSIRPHPSQEKFEIAEAVAPRRNRRTI
ncbi:MAG: hypothetical protein WKF71_11725 [Pyrinomonadaceae bacterium]